MAINRAGGAVLLAVELRSLLDCEFSAVGGAVASDLAIHGSFAAFETRSFTRGQPPALNALSDTVLLIFLALQASLFGFVFCTAALCLSPSCHA